MSTSTDDVLARLRTVVGLFPGSPEARACSQGVDVIEAQQVVLLQASEDLLACAAECGNCTDGVVPGGAACEECADVRAAALRVRHGIKRGDDSRVQGWESIEEAPKNGSSVLCWRHGWDDPVFLRWKRHQVVPDSFWTEPSGDIRLVPTHFLPLGRLPGNP